LVPEAIKRQKAEKYKIEKLNAGGISNERKFALVDYIDSKGEKRP